jgi:CHAD domain-containing protein
MPWTSLISAAESEALSVSAGRHLRRVLQSLIGESEAMIPPGSFPGPEAVHDIRVNMKRARAVLKLLKAAPVSIYYQRENTALRDISALFSQSREAVVLNKTLKQLNRKYPDIFNEGTMAWFKSLVTHTKSNGNARNRKLLIASEAAERLRKAWYRTGFLSLAGVTRINLLDGLWNSFIRAESEFGKASESMSPADIHEFRKRTKDLLYQTRFFSDYNPGHFDRVYRELDSLGSLLGKCNDLSVAETLASANFQQWPDNVTEAQKVMNTIAREREKLFTEARPVAAALFASFYSAD